MLAPQLMILFGTMIELLGSGAWLGGLSPREERTALRVYSLAPLHVLSDCCVRAVTSQALDPAVMPSWPVALPSLPRWTLSFWDPFFLKLLCQRTLSPQQRHH